MTKKQAVLNLMRRRWVSPLVALQHCRLMSLSQRAGQLRREGHNVVSRRVPGQPFHEYRCYD